MVDIKKISEEVLRELEAQEKGTTRPCPIQGQGARMRDVTCAEVPRKLEHSLLVADMTREKLLAECQVAKQWGVGAVCVAPYYVEEAAQALAGTNVAVCAAIGFPSVLGLYFNVFHPLIQTYIFITLTLTFIAEATE